MEFLERNKKWIILGVILVLCGVFAAGIVSMRQQKLSNEKKSQAAQQTIILREQIRMLEGEAENLRQEYASRVNGSSGVMLAFTDLVKGDVTETMQFMDDNGFCGLVVFSDGRTPGDANCISMEDYTALLGKGWESAVGSTKDIKLTELISSYELQRWQQYVESVVKEFEDKGLETPTIYCFNENEDTSWAVPLLRKMGFTTFIGIADRGEDGWFSYDSLENGMLNGVQADFDNKDILNDIQKYTALGYSTVLLFNRIEYGIPQGNTSENTDFYRFQSFVNAVLTSERKSLITTVKGYLDYQEELADTMGQERMEYESERDSILLEIASLHEQIAEIRAKAGLE